MRHGLFLRVFFAVLAVVACLALATRSFAAPGGRNAGRIGVSLPGGAAGPLVLVPGPNGCVGQFSVTNLGAEPLGISRLALRGDEDDVRSPSHLGVRFAEGAATSATLPPGASRDIVVSWTPERDTRVRQAFGHVVVTSTDEETGEIAVGFRAQLPTALGWVGAHALSLLVAFPLLVVLLAGAALLARRREEPLVRRIAIGAGFAQLALALWTWARFAPDVSKAQGNDGFQLVEHSAWIRAIGAEWYLGVDGVSIALVVLVAILGLVSLVVADPGGPRTHAYHAAHALLVSGLTAAFVALDMVVFFMATQVVLVASVMLIGGWGGARGERAASKMGVHGAIGSLAMLAAFVALSRASDRTYLVDGTAVLHTLSLPELARTSFLSKAPILGLPFVAVVWSLLFLAIAAATPLVPLHGWLVDALDEAPPGCGILVGGAAVAIGPYLLVRVGLAAMPEGARWAGSSIAAFGALSLVYGALCAMAQRDLRRFVAYTTVAAGGGCVLGAGAFTAAGISGACAGMFAHGLAVALLLGVAGALQRRTGTAELARLGGLGSEAPSFGLLLGIGLAVSVGVPLFVGFWGPLLVLLGAFGRHPVLAILLAAGLVLSSAAHLRVGRMVLLGKADPARRKTAALQPYGGRIPDATPWELASLVPLVLLALLLGVWPAPLLSPITTGARDTSAAVDPAGPNLSP
jgi:NADH-quinone oxidoreductase subunit M